MENINQNPAAPLGEGQVSAQNTQAPQAVPSYTPGQPQALAGGAGKWVKYKKWLLLLLLFLAVASGAVAAIFGGAKLFKGSVFDLATLRQDYIILEHTYNRLEADQIPNEIELNAGLAGFINGTAAITNNSGGFLGEAAQFTIDEDNSAGGAITIEQPAADGMDLLGMGADNFAMMGWVKTNSADKMGLFGQYDSVSPHGYAVYMEDGKLGLTMNGSESLDIPAENNPLYLSFNNNIWRNNAELDLNITPEGNPEFINQNDPGRGSLQFDGNDSVTVADNDNLDFHLGNALSYGAWIKTNMDGHGYIIKKATAPNADGYTLEIDRGIISCNIGHHLMTAREEPINDGQWHFVMCTLTPPLQQGQGAASYIYIDGVVNNVLGLEGSRVNDRSLIIGQNFTGEMDEVRLYNVALTDDQVLTLYNETRSPVLTVLADEMAPINDGQWHFVAAVFNRNSDAVFYVGDEAGAELTKVGQINISEEADDLSDEAPFVVGAFDSNYFNGLIDELRVFRYPVGTADADGTAIFDLEDVNEFYRNDLQRALMCDGNEDCEGDNICRADDAGVDICQVKGEMEVKCDAGDGTADCAEGLDCYAFIGDEEPVCRVMPALETTIVNLFGLADNEFVFDPQIAGGDGSSLLANFVLQEPTIPDKLSVQIKEHGEGAPVIFSARGARAFSLLEAGVPTANYDFAWNGQKSDGAHADSESYEIILNYTDAGNESHIIGFTPFTLERCPEGLERQQVGGMCVKTCDEDIDCDAGMVCRFNSDDTAQMDTCQMPAEAGVRCDEDADCRAGLICWITDQCTALPTEAGTLLSVSPAIFNPAAERTINVSFTLDETFNSQIIISLFNAGGELIDWILGPDDNGAPKGIEQSWDIEVINQNGNSFLDDGNYELAVTLLLFPAQERHLIRIPFRVLTCDLATNAIIDNACTDRIPCTNNNDAACTSRNLVCRTDARGRVCQNKGADDAICDIEDGIADCALGFDCYDAAGGANAECHAMPTGANDASTIRTAESFDPTVPNASLGITFSSNVETLTSKLSIQIQNAAGDTVWESGDMTSVFGATIEANTEYILFHDGTTNENTPFANGNYTIYLQYAPLGGNVLTIAIMDFAVARCDDGLSRFAQGGACVRVCAANNECSDGLVCRSDQMAGQSICQIKGNVNEAVCDAGEDDDCDFDLQLICHTDNTCRTDEDGDRIPTGNNLQSRPDNCPLVSNPDQTDSDDDGAGDACDRITGTIGGFIPQDLVEEKILFIQASWAGLLAFEIDTNQDELIDLRSVTARINDSLENRFIEISGLDRPITYTVKGEFEDQICYNDNCLSCPLEANSDKSQPVFCYFDNSINSFLLAGLRDGVTVRLENDFDDDGDLNRFDNCINAANPEQENLDFDEFGDACDDNKDGDDVPDDADACPMNPANICETGELDKICSGVDSACVSNFCFNNMCAQTNTVEDGGACAVSKQCSLVSLCREGICTKDDALADDDQDGLTNANDNCPLTINADQADLDNDEEGNACDSDADGDKLPNASDACPLDRNNICRTGALETTCISDDSCANGFCLLQKCALPKSVAQSAACVMTRQCAEGLICDEKICQAPAQPAAAQTGQAPAQAGQTPAQPQPGGTPVQPAQTPPETPCPAETIAAVNFLLDSLNKTNYRRITSAINLYKRENLQCPDEIFAYPSETEIAGRNAPTANGPAKISCFTVTPSFDPSSNEKAYISCFLGNDVDEWKVQILSTELVTLVSEGTTKAGLQLRTWDGRTSQGIVRDGTYGFIATAKNAKGSAVAQGNITIASSARPARPSAKEGEPEVVVAEEEMPAFIFSDVSNTHPNARAIYEMKKRNVVQGRDDGSFRPQNGLLKIETLVLALRAAGINPDPLLAPSPLGDVQNPNAWYYSYVNTAYDLGIIKGDKDGLFNPSKQTNLAEFLAMITAAMKTDLSPYQAKRGEPWYKTYENFTKAKNLIDTFVANYEISRAGSAEILWRLLR